MQNFTKETSLPAEKSCSSSRGRDRVGEQHKVQKLTALLPVFPVVLSASRKQHTWLLFSQGV